MAEVIKSLENLPRELQEKLIERICKEALLSKNNEEADIDGEEFLPLWINGKVYRVPSPVFDLVEELSNGLSNDKE
ncbi:hypothetical protein CMI47_21740 [Candidatus Pacearchaeota archaeon]|jgi:hypothetical protein|nr:hypothetical protein [Candidatus Pacearchaeota archaeon]